ncbi:hypothetical protein M406DRAFT_257547 [Cryphonectria parasitica EP155]|uniref:Uncharacterized protein n=1 Tax=Cryphonectria parasitica (strain ATCC 38755 / EP155) TaxID=660469 RepID=A0A9P4Y405_CRYP1|nr:uncharacterized protein M406DRAFT_257547 [Cryphonectria parasitica EP155]KAF3766060.1 hypothetical protein M406DRAFT_257547 [Cryphonectria parasitica EP155]
MASSINAPQDPEGPPSVTPAAYKPRYIDIGINLADPIFRGVYNGKQRHDDDLAGVVGRARQVGCTKLIVTGSSFKSSRDALTLAEEYPGTIYTTAGIHPCSSSIFDATHQTSHQDDEGEGDETQHTPPCDPDPDAPIPDSQTTDPARTESIISDLRALITSGWSSSALVAFGEFGLDYDRLHYCSRSLQLHSFSSQLVLAANLTPQLPLFLHSRAAHSDFVSCLRTAFGPRLERLVRGGVVHSFTGTAAEMVELMDLGLYIGLNGCSFKTAENCEVVRAVRLDRLMLETDGPWCEVRPSHEGWKYLVEVEKAEREAEEAAKAEMEAARPRSAMETESLPTAENGVAENGNGSVEKPRPRKKPQQQPSKKSQKKEPEVPERFKTVKKDKWVEGAMVKGRNEPCTIERVAKIVAAIKGVPVQEVCEAAWSNTVKVFGLDES